MLDTNDLTGQGQAAETAATDQATVNWKDKYHGLYGAFQQQQAKWTQERDALRQAAAQHEERARLLEDQMQSLAQQLDALRSAAQERDALRHDLEATRRQLGRMHLLADQGITDPAMRRLILSSDLPDDEIGNLVRELHQRQQVATQQALAQAAQGSVPPNVPAAKGNGTAVAHDLEARMERALREGRFDGPDGYWALLSALMEVKK